SLYVPHRRAVDVVSGERRIAKIGINQLSPFETCPSEIHPAELRILEVCHPEVCPREIRFLEVRPPKVRLRYFTKLFSPLIPGVCSLPENLEVFLTTILYGDCQSLLLSIAVLLIIIFAPTRALLSMPPSSSSGERHR